MIHLFYWKRLTWINSNNDFIHVTFHLRPSTRKPGSLRTRRKNLMSEHLIIVGVFKEEIRAESAIAVLKDVGFNNDQIVFTRYTSKSVIDHTLDNLVNMGMSEEEVSYYKSECEAGRSLVLVQHQGRRSETIAILLLNGAKNHKYLQKTENMNKEPSNISTSTNIGLPDQPMDSQNSSANSLSRATDIYDRGLLTEDELASLRKLLENEGFGHLL
jgi:hypothetical protein